MDKTLKIIIALFVLLLVSLGLIEYFKPKEIDWNHTYSTTDKIPFGLYVLDHQMKSLFPESNIKKVNKSFYEYVTGDSDYETTNTVEEIVPDTLDRELDSTVIESYDNPDYYNNTTQDTVSELKGLLFYVSEFSRIDKNSFEKILKFTALGNTTFISATDFPPMLKDSLGINSVLEMINKDSLTVTLCDNPTTHYKYNLGAENVYFNKYNTKTTTVLGYHVFKNKKVADFIKVKYKKGFFLIHTQPQAFINYYLLNKKNHYLYTEKVLSYLPKNIANVYWIGHTNLTEGELKEQGILQFIKKTPPLLWAWRIFLLGLLLFIIFYAKRKQRIVPIIKPVTNTTVEFTKTIGNLYFQEGNHQNMIDKKIIYFLEKIRSEYYIDTSNLNEDFVEKLHQKTGKPLDDVKHLVKLINFHKSSKDQAIESDLIELNKAIEIILS